MLEPIYWLCINHHWPQLTVLVVNSTTGLPGTGLALGDSDRERERAFRCDWFAIEPPETEDFRVVLKERKLPQLFDSLDLT